MKFYVIYDFDVPHDLSVKSCNPPFRSRNFKLTECHESEIFCPEYAGITRRRANIGSTQAFLPANNSMPL